ncbi:signal peptidase II [Aestuariibius insulae]|uniref:signal peptidase II n=1 Tax=Aestuariibius insulae TaxID=2058287 RepID=UPI00345EA73A
MRLTFWTGFWVFLIDQISKYVVVHMLDLQTRKAIDVVPPFLNLRMAWNEGINFGLFSTDSNTMRWILIGFALALSVGVLIWIAREAPGKWGYVSAGILVGGALGNVIDRILYGAVADFLNMSCCGIDNPYAFNVADIAIFVGAIGLILFTGETKETRSSSKVAGKNGT